VIKDSRFSYVHPTIKNLFVPIAKKRRWKEFSQFSVFQKEENLYPPLRGHLAQAVPLKDVTAVKFSAAEDL